MTVRFYRREGSGKQARQISHGIQVNTKVSLNGSMLFVDNIHHATFDGDTDSWMVKGTTQPFDGMEIL